MTRINWDSIGQRFYEAGVDRGVLYVDGKPAVPWTGLISVNTDQSGGEIKPRFLDGIMISNRTTPETFEGSIQAYTYPLEFEECDGTKFLENGLRATRQRRKSFNLAYRTRVGSDVDGLDHSYKIHILYNVRAQPTERPHRTMGDQVEPLQFSWQIIAREPIVSGLRPTAHYIIDSKTVPAGLLSQIEDVLYGTEGTDPSLPTAGELIFMFDSFEDMSYDAGFPSTPVFAIYDAGTIDTPVLETIDGGTP